MKSKVMKKTKQLTSAKNKNVKQRKRKPVPGSLQFFSTPGTCSYYYCKIFKSY